METSANAPGVFHLILVLSPFYIIIQNRFPRTQGGVLGGSDQSNNLSPEAVRLVSFAWFCFFFNLLSVCETLFSRYFALKQRLICENPMLKYYFIY